MGLPLPYVITIFAVIVGGWWLFYVILLEIKERKKERVT